MGNRRVSVIIPTYNRAYCLQTAIGSLQAQTYRDWEAVVVDDGSTDDTEATVRGMIDTDPRVRYHRQANGGVSAARNKGMDLATGDWIGFLDSDDSWEPWKLEAQVACFDHIPDVGMIWTDMNAFDADGRLLSSNHLRKMYSAYRRVGDRQVFVEECRLSGFAPEIARRADVLANAMVRRGNLYTAMIFGSLVHTSTVLISRERLGKVGRFEERYRTGEDYDFHLRTCREGPVALLDAPSIRYRMAGGADQLTSPAHVLEMALNGLQIRETAIARDRDRIELSDAELGVIVAYANHWIADELFQRGEYRRARPYFRRSLPLRSHESRLFLKTAITHLPQPLATWLVRALRSES